MRFEEKLAILLDRKGWTPAKLLEKLREAGHRVARNGPYRWVNGERKPRLSDLCALSRVLGVSLDVLAFDEMDVLPTDGQQARRIEWVRGYIDRIGWEETERRLIWSQPGPHPSTPIQPTSGAQSEDQPRDRPAHDGRA